MRLDFTVVEVLDFSLSVPILLEHPVICRQNVANKNNINNLLEEHYNNVKNNGRLIYNIYIFLIWYEKYFIENN